MERPSTETVDAVYNRGIELHLEGRLDEAMASYRRAIELAPRHARAYGNLGAALREAGDLDGAAEHLRIAIGLDPRAGRFHRLLLDLRRGVVTPSHLAQMETLLHLGDKLTDDQRVELLFALAGAYATGEQYNRAFERLRAANDLKRSACTYDEDETLESFGRMPAMFAEPLFRALPDSGDRSSLPVFIFGMPRSGTTLVEQLLAAHPQVRAGGELGTVKLEMEHFAKIEADPYDGARFAAALAGEFTQLGARCTRRFEAIASGAARVTDKWPWSFLFVGAMHLALPNARLIHVRRDPLDTCFSCYSTLFTDDLPYTYDLGELGRYYAAYERLMEHWRAVLPPGAMLEVRYEELVGDFDRQAVRIVEHCGLAWDPACAAFWTVRRPVFTASAASVRHPLFRDGVGRARPYASHLEPLSAALAGASGA